MNNDNCYNPEKVTIEMQVNIGYGRKLIRSAYQPDLTQIREAGQPLHINDPFSGQSEGERQEIRLKRKYLARELAASLTEHLLDQWLAVNDTFNGYTKEDK